jgi:subtilase family serine protease
VTRRLTSWRTRHAIGCGLAIGALALAAATTHAAPAGVRLKGNLPLAVAQAERLVPLEADRELSFAFTLPVRDPAALEDFLRRLYTPGDPLFHQYLKTGEFADRFGPTQADYDALRAFAEANGLRVTRAYTNRAVLDVSGPVHAIESALAVRMMQYRSPEGRVFHAPDGEPALPASLADRGMGVVGLDDAVEPRSNLRVVPGGTRGGTTGIQGTGPNNRLSPSDIKNAYDLTGVTETGAGLSIALFELDGYRTSDIRAYEDQFGLPHVALVDTLLNGVSGIPTAPTPKNPYPLGPAEVTLDIELAQALCPNLDQIHVYEGNNYVDLYNQIASDNTDELVSSSWYYGLDTAPPQSVRDAENTAFQQMASQGQSFYAASGDFGDKVCTARDSLGNCTTQVLGVQDPSAQPYCTGVGGTQVTTQSNGGPWYSETAWSGSGGGVSAVWAVPYYQSAAVTPGSGGSSTARNVPDVSLDSISGYAIYYYGVWQSYTGTSCAAPLWAGFTALVDQRRLAHGQGLLGFPNPALYYLAQTNRYGIDFHDIKTGNNGTYAAVTGRDNVTGWGTFDGGQLIGDLGINVLAYWVDGNYAGLGQIGTPDHPYKTIGLALAAVPTGYPTILYIKGHAYLENPTISGKTVLMINNGGGVVTIGN